MFRLDAKSGLVSKIFFYVLILLIFIWQYGGLFWANLFKHIAPWHWILATLLIAFCARIFWGQDWKNVLGLSINRWQTVFCLAALLLSLPVFYFLIHFVLVQGGFQVNASAPHLSRVLVRVFQPLNEEIVLRAILLGLLARIISNRFALSVLLAIVFSSLHFLLYKFGILETTLTISALLTLFFFSLAVNALFFTFGHIGYGFALHFAWNWWRFEGDISKNGISLNEAQTFNILEGSTAVLISVACLSILSVIGLEVHRNRRHPVPFV